MCHSHDTVVVRRNRLTGQTPSSNSVNPPRNRQNRPSKRAAGWDPRRWSVPHSGLGAGRARAAMRGLGDMVLAALTQTAQYSVVSTSDRASSVPRPLPSNYVKTEPALGPPVKSVKTESPAPDPRQIRQSGETARQNHRPLRTPTTTVSGLWRLDTQTYKLML